MGWEGGFGFDLMELARGGGFVLVGKGNLILWDGLL
jgi:hypothetical protein